MKHFLMFATCVPLGVLLVGCGGSSSSAPTLRDQVVGKWTIASINALGLTQTCPGALVVAGQNVDSCSASDYFEFKSDGTYSQSKGALSGTWSLADSTISYTVTVAGSPTNRTFTVSSVNATTLVVVSGAGLGAITYSTTR